MIDIVIPFRLDRFHNNVELKYALQSIQKYAKGYRDIYLIGDNCSFQVPVKHIYARDTDNRANYNIWRKTMLACGVPEISDPFLFTNDDIFFLQETDISSLPDYYYRTIGETINSHMNSGYILYLKNTVAITSPDARYFDIHTPILYYKDRFREMTKMDWSRTDYVVKTLYGRGLKGQEMEDCKINAPRTYQEIMDTIVGRKFFSTGPMGINGAMIRVFRELFQ